MRRNEWGSEDPARCSSENSWRFLLSSVVTPPLNALHELLCLNMASSSSAISPSHEALFNASKIELHIPNASDLADESEDGPKDLHDHAARKVAFLGA